MTTNAGYEARNFADDRHNLYVGWIFGIALKYDLPFQPVYDDNGIVTDRMTFTFPTGITITVIVPPPPDDWTPNDRSEA